LTNCYATARLLGLVILLRNFTGPSLHVQDVFTCSIVVNGLGVLIIPLIY
jgi:hypothetical protein